MCLPSFSIPSNALPPALPSFLPPFQINFRSLVETHGGVFTTQFNVHVTALIACEVGTDKYRVSRWR